MAQRRFTDPIKYEVGKDLTQERYTEIVLGITEWFSQSRTTREPAAAARKALQDCLEGKKSDGSPWFAMAMSTLANRVRSKCRFDIETMKPLVNSSDRTRERKEKAKERDARKRTKALHDPFIPEALITEQVAQGARSVKYGDDPRVLLSTAELKQWNKWKADYLQQFPELMVHSAQAELDQLCDVLTLTQRLRLKMLAGERVDIKERSSVGEDVQRLKKALGIHPDQLVKRVQPRTDTTIGAAAAKLESMGNWRQVRERFWAEELLQMFQMYMQPSADGQGYQLDEIGLYGMTKCRTCTCRCGRRNFAGMDIGEIEAWLVEHDHLTPTDEESNVSSE